MKPLNVAVIGVGRLGTLYARYFLGRITGARLVAVCDSNKQAAESFAAEHNVTRWYRDYEYVLSDKEVDAVVIVTPTNTHKQIALDAIASSKAVFCEKPPALSLPDAVAMGKAVERAGAFFHLGFMRRFDRGYAAAKRKIERGEIGTVCVFKSSSRDPYPPPLEYLDPKASGGLFVDCGIHDFDLARWLIGEVRSVHSIAGVLAFPEFSQVGDVDNAITTLTFNSGVIGSIDLSRSGVYGYDIRTEVLGTAGTLKIGYLKETPITILTKDGVSHDTVPYFTQRFEQAYVDQLQNFISHLSQGKPPSITAADGVAALKIALAATTSWKEACSIEVG
ncbi:MAG TPA: Gfo/Idh/MocA family oxidoreductase [Blastocatellia bacterium]